ncbi:hypothetical protein JB92DRAFT_2961415 [Gautieria morchelliformis]|nr:hypothetical protein JB92DRAFT_2961415 [Gautieria morchelliformis]
MSLVRSDLNQATPEKTTTTPAKPEKVKFASPIAELKNGKVVFKQKPISFENLSETMQEIVSFRNCVKDVDNPVSMIPDHHLPLIAKLVHESDKSVTSLAKTLQSLLLPPTLESSSQVAEAEALRRLKPSVVEHAIKTVAERVNYGINADMDKPPAALCIWRWEVKNQDWLPKSMSDRVSQRFRERVAAKAHLQSIFDALPEDERDAMLQNGKGKVSKGKDAAISPLNAEDRDTRTLQETQIRESSESAEPDAKKGGRPKKSLDPETIAKEKERQEQKAIKAEKEKKVAEATKKSAAVFAKFFKPVPLKSINATDAPSSTSGSSTPAHLNEFQLTFKSFVVKKDAHLAPINYFVAQKRDTERLQSDTNGQNKNAQCVIELDDEGREVHIPKDRPTSEVHNEVNDVIRLSTLDILRSFVESQPPSLHPKSRTAVASRLFKTEPKYCVRKIMHQLNDAEVQGDQRTTRRLTALLKNRRKLPAKVLVFHENNRPGYIGTWTRSSPTIGPRTPFTRDLLTFDYDHDSDAEWEEEAEGSVDDVESLDGSVEDDRSSTESDMGDWLVEGDEIEVETTNPQALDELTAPPTNSSVKRKSIGSGEQPSKKRRVVPLIPFQKGPVWEREVGDCDYEPFRPMRIQLFNDTPFPVDPFSFVSGPMTAEKANNNPDSEGLFVMPALPDRLQKLPAATTSTDDSVAKRKALNSALPPKTSFPDTHVPLLLQKIGASNTNSFVVLLDSLFQDLKALGIKKNALEVKLREVSEKDKSKRAWVVKDQAWIRHGLIKPT